MEPVFPFDIALPPRGRGTLTRELHQQLRAAILDGRLRAGAAMPATRTAAAALGIARNTVVAAYDLLIAEGYLRPRQGAKAIVAETVPRRAARRRQAPRLDDPRLNPTWRTPLLGASAADELPERCLRLGVPEHRYFPHDAWRRVAMRALRELAHAPFRYSPAVGLAPLREAIAQHAAFTRAVACTGDDVIVTSGAQQAFDLLARLLVTPGRTRVAVEEPGYPPLRAAFAAAGAQLLPVAVDAEGLCVEQLPGDVQVISVTPSHQFPTGVALSRRRRNALLEYARARGALIVEDDYDGEFRFGGRPLDALQTLDRDAQVFYVGTFSKSLFPSLRKGFIVAPAWAREALAALKQCADAHCDTVMQATLAHFIRDGHLARHVRRMQALYAQRRAALLEVLQTRLAPWLAPIASEAGLHLAARIHDPQRAAQIVAAARCHAPGTQATGDFSLAPPASPALVFGYGVIDAAEIPVALMQLRRALQRLG